MPKEDEVKKAVEEGLQLLGRQKQVGQKVREQSKGVYGRLMDAHCLAMSVIASATSPMSGKPGKSDPDLAHMLSLSASFIQGIDICETAISEGYYVSATALLKQEMETIAAIAEVRNKTRRTGSTPNVKVFGKLAVLYGDLNRVAHVADSDLMQQLVRIEVSEQQAGAPLFPVFNADQAKFLYGLHVSLLAMIALEVGAILEELYGAGLRDFETVMLARVARILQDEGWLQS